MRIKFLASALLCSVTFFAQSYEDAIRYSQPQIQGTARYMSMGGAFTSLGGDYSAIGLNPAGIASYRSSEFSFTSSINISASKGNINGSSNLSDNKTTFSINQFGYVGTVKPMREVTKGIVSTHFAIGYNRNNNFNYRSMASLFGASNSMTDYFKIDADDGYFDDYHTDLAYNAYLIDPVYDENGNETGEFTNYLYDTDLVDQTRVIEKSGNSSEINFTAGMNISNILQLGASINYNMIHYDEESYYYEQFSDQNTYNADAFSQYKLYDYLKARGNGVSLKAGFIVKPLPKLRIGASFHSPTWYSIQEDYGSDINADFYNYDSQSSWTDSYFDYNFSTPLKVEAGISYILGKYAIFSFDYEYIDYASSKFKSKTNNIDDLDFIASINSTIKSELTAANNYRAGIEVRIHPQISLRGGYAFQDSPYKTEPKDNSLTNITAGIGYKVDNFFLDCAYVNSQYSHGGYIYDWSTEYDDSYGAPSYNNYKTTDHYAVVTMGWKF